MQNKITKGLTMVELIITLALLSVVGAATGATLLNGFQLYVANRQAAQVHGNANNALMVIGRDVQQSISVVNSNGTPRAAGDWVAGLHLQVPGATPSAPPVIITYSLPAGADNVSRNLARAGAPANWSVPFVCAELYGFYTRVVGSHLYVSVLVQPTQPNPAVTPAARAATGVTTRIALDRVAPGNNNNDNDNDNDNEND